MERVRYKYTLTLSDRVGSVDGSAEGVVFRNPCLADVDPLATLLLDAYRGTIDDEGEGVDDARRFVVSALTEEALLSASWLALEGDCPVSAVLVRRWKGQPLVTVIATHPRHTRRRLASCLLDRTLEVLRSSGERELVAFITRGNVASEALFVGRGFQSLGSRR
jgi:hypothetical protein